MKKIKNNYTNFILTVIAVAMIGLLFKGEIIKPAHALGPSEDVFLYVFFVCMCHNVVLQSTY